jgi:predicted RND superfamily exporter protein
LKGLFGNDLSSTNLKTKWARTILRFGGPLDVDGIRYTSVADREDDQIVYYTEFSKELHKYVFDENDGVIDGIKVNFVSREYYRRLFRDIIAEDSILIIWSLIFVLVFFTIFT